ncbi:MAG TPA: HEAT repeat domain-containing protein [Tepidisphaeraceae bacterium]|jgi:HEAT repeat protein
MIHRHRLILGLISTTTLLVGCAGTGQRPLSAVERQVPAPKQPPAPPPIHNVPLDPSLQAAARAQLDAALGSNDPFIRSHAIEALNQTAGVQARGVYLNGLKDPSSQVRFTSAMAIGQLQIADARDELLQLVNDPNARVRIAVRFALHRLGDTSYTKDLEQTAKEPLVWQIRADTAMVLGMLKEPTAVRVLRPMQRDPQAAVRIQVAEALWRLGDEQGLRNLVAATQSAYPDDQMVALMGLAAPKDTRIMGHLRSSLTADYPEVCLVAARAMGMLGSDAGYAIAADLARSRDANQRMLAALALGAIGRPDAQPLLADLLKDRDSADIRLCAAQAILQLKPPTAPATARGE